VPPVERSVTRLLALLAALGLAFLTGASPEPGRQIEHRDARYAYSVSYPSSWYRAEEPVSGDLMDPREILSLATFQLRQHDAGNCEAFAGAARAQLGPADVYVTVQERGTGSGDWRDFPPRPEHFGPFDPAPGELGCMDHPGTAVDFFGFTDAGRHFYGLVVIGEEVPARVRDEAWAVLDSLRFDAGYTPDWEASG
jgi:hypothetical protein